MAEKCLFICDSCYEEYKNALHIEQKSKYQKISHSAAPFTSNISRKTSNDDCSE
jgi:hypothetical protein